MKITHYFLLIFSLFLLTACQPAVIDPTLPANTEGAATLLPNATATDDLPPTLTPTLIEATPTSAPTSEPTRIPAPTAAPPSGPPGIILFIGDGMGAVHRQAATWLVSGEGGLLVMDNMPVHGLAQTASANNLITDSAAAATAMSTGGLTNNGYLGVDPSRQTLTSILELAQAGGWSVGLVTTVQLSHATPGAFASHFPDRSNRTEIARQIMVHQIDVLLGGGEDDFTETGESGCYPGNGHQRAGSGLTELAEQNGYTYICTAEELQALDLAQVDHLLGLFGGEEILPPFQPDLAEMTEAAISILSQDPDGFFLLVEGGQIDWEAHKNEAQGTMQNTAGLDTAVAMAQFYALSNPNTLIIVAADHETGGMRINRDGKGSFQQDGPFSMPDGSSFWVDWTTTSHTGDPIPVTAQGPFSDMLAGEYHLTRIFETMTAMLFNAIQ